MGRRKKGIVTADEVVWMVYLVAKLNPDNYVDHEVRSVIHKCQGLVANQPDMLVIK